MAMCTMVAFTQADTLQFRELKENFVNSALIAFKIVVMTQLLELCTKVESLLFLHQIIMTYLLPSGFYCRLLDLVLHHENMKSHQPERRSYQTGLCCHPSTI